MKENVPSAGGYLAASWMLACDQLVLRAIAIVESGQHGAFLPDDQPVILFERHLFSRFTSHRFDGASLNGHHEEWNVLSARTPGGYGPVGVQHAKLQAAAKLDRDAALRSCSWGLFQILGDNHVACGYPELQRFINAMYRSADDHLRALVMFIRHDLRLVDALRSKNWAVFAYVYNGPQYQQNQYDKKMERAYLDLST